MSGQDCKDGKEHTGSLKFWLCYMALSCVCYLLSWVFPGQKALGGQHIQRAGNSGSFLKSSDSNQVHSMEWQSTTQQMSFLHSPFAPPPANPFCLAMSPMKVTWDWLSDKMRRGRLPQVADGPRWPLMSIGHFCDCLTEPPMALVPVPPGFDAL